MKRILWLFVLAEGLTEDYHIRQKTVFERNLK